LAITRWILTGLLPKYTGWKQPPRKDNNFMLSKEQFEQYRQQVSNYFQKAHIALTPAEQGQIEIADFGLGQFEQTGLGVLVYVNTERVCAKELAMLPHQTCPEHRHPWVGNAPGKEETFRVRWGKMYLYVPGEAAAAPHCKPPAGREETYTIFHEIELNPGEQYTLHPNTLHWFQAGPDGAVVSEFSTRSTDENDIFTDAEIARVTKVS
jgi:D-lyxose ketol-isomerase